MNALTALGLLWFVLARRSRRFSDLGLRWHAPDLGFGILLCLGGYLAFVLFYSFVHGALAAAHLLPAPGDPASMFAMRLSFGVVLFQFLNPVFEELIVRAYVITEVRRLTNSATLAVACSVGLQMSYHFYQGLLPALSHSATFLIYSVYYAKTNRILAPIVAHFLLDVAGLWYYSVKTGTGG